MKITKLDKRILLDLLEREFNSIPTNKRKTYKIQISRLFNKIAEYIYD